VLSVYKDKMYLLHMLVCLGRLVARILKWHGVKFKPQCKSIAIVAVVKVGN
jgi:hypothetical protein